MDNPYRHFPSDAQPPVYNGGFLEAPYPANRAPPSLAHEHTQPDHSAPQWTPSPGYDHRPCEFRRDFPAPCPSGGWFGAPRFAPPYGFDSSVPLPPFGCPPPERFLHDVPGAPLNSMGPSPFQIIPQHVRPGPQTTTYDPDPSCQNHDYQDFSETAAPFGCTPRGREYDRHVGTATQAKDEAALQRKQDQQWIRRFLQRIDKNPKLPQTQQQQSGITGMRGALDRAAQLISQLAESCTALRNTVENESVWTESYLMTINVKRELQDSLVVLSDSACVETLLSRVAKRRARRLRARQLQMLEEKQREDSISEKEAAIDKWRMQQIHQVEEKKKEQELKLAADTVLCEVRKKQADVKRMQDVLRSLEKLRRLRKEAALRKGIITEQECEQAFSSRLEQLRCVLKKRTAVYSTEEKALMVMLEGEQEEDRRREQEKRVKKERDRQLQRKHKVDAILFGDELPADSYLQPFREYYTQAERSLHALLQIRREWDAFVASAGHPDCSPVPQSWVLPDAPSDQAWASSLHTADTE
ncbi:programmed cell death protein 7 [Pagrus major]|uniref:programmed cell death protein 7 n=1 Tax=Pagrus major TaxID=143350 RepID=UPI003CC8C1FE